MPGDVKRKWRPPLALIVCGAMAGIVAVPVLGLSYFRVAGNVLGWAETAWLILWLAIVSAAILGYLLWRLVLRPVTALTVYARDMKAGRAGTPPAHFGTPEFSDLGHSVIAMGATLQNRAATMRAYADHVTHEMKSPLTAITGAAELLNDATDDERSALMATIAASAARMDQLLGDLRRHAAAGLARRGGEILLSSAAGQITDLTVTVNRDGKVPMPEEDLVAVLKQLSQNAATHAADRITLDWDAGRLTVADNGSGVSQGNRDRLFDPFFTTTRAQGGTGMGLAIVRALIGAHGGTIAHVPTQNGAVFEISF
ncbi:Signal transduction histidine-protein kinase BaeS [Sulfitobacter sp. THAF37]|uniref:sensor histidine kinase n=1 Tax=Sulfitobacter sp. THAF37 TaxID=2587855 RepID=UPI0012685F11|nr:HAMP domain-containing sensor histidine kinase [Sulfitobacter sp. THAF37]QFT58566.1 Signal transduction histidine-protein kinase BaeS [Sulfitobacter sp. THAF37]